MAAAQAEMRNFLADVIGIADSPGTNIHARRDAVRNEGLEVMADLIEFDDEDVKTLCASVRKPGGTIPDPAGARRQIQDPGHSIPAISEKRLKLACYGSRIYDLIDRPITADSLSRNRLREFEQHQITIEDHTEPETLPVISKTFGIMRALDILPTHLRERIGSQKVALLYIIRENEEPARLRNLEADRITSAEYDSIMDELIARTPHNGPKFREDNALVYQIVQDLVAGSTHE